MIVFEDVTLRRGSRLLFESSSFRIHTGQKVGLTGRNGTGKSSVFGLLQKTLEPDNGNVELSPSWVIAHVAQQTPQTERSAIDYVLDGDEELRNLQIALANESDGTRQAELHARFDTIDGYRAESRAAQLLNGLGFTSDQINHPVNSFSGGWRMRLNLARALMCRSDLLLLDEPTNHLDLDAVIWLEQWLRSYSGTLILISHDRDFLDKVIDHVLHIEQESVTLYSGNYSLFEVIRAERLANQQAAYQKQQREIQHMQQFVDRFRAKATKAKQAQSRLKTLERMEQIAPAHVDSPFHFSFLNADKLPNPLLRLADCSAGYAAKVILSDIQLIIENSDRIGLLGPNGAGKSTLIKLIAGIIAPSSGKRQAALDCKVGYFAQHQIEQLDPDHSPLDHLLQIDAKISDQEARNFLGGFGFNGERVFEKVEPFSGGEKARLALALIIYQKPNLLLLDEPTNHLDIEMRNALAQALQSYLGAMLLVSHDRFMIRTTCDELLLVYGNRVTPFEQELDDYAKWLASINATEDHKPITSTTSLGRKKQKRIEAERRQRLAPLRKEIAKIEQTIDALTEQKTAVEQQLADQSIYDDDKKELLKELIAQNGQLEQALAHAESAWLEETDQLEKLSAHDD